MKTTNIAVQLYSVRDDAATDLYGTLKKVKSYGYKGVEFAGLHGHDPLEVKKMCEELDLIPLSAHVPFKELCEDLEKVIEDYHKIGVKYIVIPYLIPKYRPGQEEFQTVIDQAKIMGQALKKYDMVLQYHNHDFEFEKIDGKYALDILYEEVPSELLQTQLDTCWINVGGENPAEYIKKYAGRIPTVHLKDFAGMRSEKMYALIGIDDDSKKEVSGKFEFRPLGKGVQQFAEIIETSLACGAEWFIVEQDSPSLGYTPLECIEMSISYLKSIL